MAPGGADGVGVGNIIISCEFIEYKLLQHQESRLPLMVKVGIIFHLFHWSPSVFPYLL